MMEQVDMPDSNSGAARREGSNPSPRTAVQNLHDWNAGVFADARHKAEETFDALISKQDRREDDEEMPTLF